MQKTAKYLRYAARTLLIIVSSFWFIFALLSGSQDHERGIRAIVMNSPNALPWLLMGVLVYATIKWELLGGLLTAGAGVFTIFFFHAYKSAFVLFAIPVPLVIAGGFLIVSWYLKKNKFGGGPIMNRKIGDT